MIHARPTIIAGAVAAVVVGMAAWTATGEEPARQADVKASARAVAPDPAASPCPTGTVDSTRLKQALAGYRLSVSLRTPPPAPAKGIDDVAAVQQALDAYSRGQLADAATLSEQVASHPVTPNGRAWIIAASAYHARGEYADAADAYRAFLGVCRSPSDREFALGKLAECRQHPAKSTAAPTVPSELLTSKQIEELSEVTDRTCIESSAHFVVESHNPKLSKLLAEQAEQALRRITKVVMRGAEYPHSVRVKVFPTVKEYRANAKNSPEWSGGSFELTVDETGFAQRAINLTQLDESGALNTDVFDRILPHELCHLVVTEWFGDAHSPLYLQEGMAMAAEYGDHSKRILLAGRDAGSGKALGLQELVATEKYDDGNVDLFYARAYSFVSYMHQRLTPKQFADTLANIKAGNPLRDALHKALYLPDSNAFMSQLEQSWQDDAIANAQYLTFLATHQDTR